MGIIVERKECDKIVIRDLNDGGFIQSQSVEANLLFEILQKLEEIRMGICDVENAVGYHS